MKIMRRSNTITRIVTTDTNPCTVGSKTLLEVVTGSVVRGGGVVGGGGVVRGVV